jgi:hypothetical protein
MILNEYESKIKNLVHNNKDKERIKLLYDELNNRNKDDLLRNYRVSSLSNIYMQETSKKRDDIDDFERNLQDLRKSMLNNDETKINSKEK